jgi:hypothetical protein
MTTHVNVTTYTCQQCGARAVVREGEIFRTCTCDAPITAHLTATATGTGTMK